MTKIKKFEIFPGGGSGLGGREGNLRPSKNSPSKNTVITPSENFGPVKNVLRMGGTQFGKSNYSLQLLIYQMLCKK